MESIVFNSSHKLATDIETQAPTAEQRENKHRRTDGGNGGADVPDAR